MATASAVPAHRAREYETIYILRPNAGEEAAEKVASRVIETIDKLNGKLVEVDVWGRRRLAYTIKSTMKGVFIYLRYVGYPGTVEELERNFKMLDAVLKFQTIKLKDEIDPATVEVDPEAIAFEGMDFSEEPEEEVTDEEGDEHGGGDAAYLDYEPEPIPAPPGGEEKAEAKAEAKPEEEAEAPKEAEAPAEEAAEAPAEEAAEAPAEEAAEAPAEEAAEAPAEEAAEAPAEEPQAETPAEEEEK